MLIMHVRDLLLGGFLYDDLYGGDVSCVSFLSQDFRGDSDFFDGEFSLEEPAPDDFDNIYRVADRLSPSLDGESVLAAVEVHHDSSRIGHQRLLADKHGIRWDLAARPFYAWPLFASFWSVLHSSFWDVFCSLCAGLVMFTCGLVLYFLTHCCCLSCQSIMLE